MRQIDDRMCVRDILGESAAYSRLVCRVARTFYETFSCVSIAWMRQIDDRMCQSESSCQDAVSRELSEASDRW